MEYQATALQWVKDAKLDATLDKLRALPSLDERCAAAREAQKIIMENALMLPTLSDPKGVAAGIAKFVNGLR